MDTMNPVNYEWAMERHRAIVREVERGFWRLPRVPGPASPRAGLRSLLRLLREHVFSSAPAHRAAH